MYQPLPGSRNLLQGLWRIMIRAVSLSSAVYRELSGGHERGSWKKKRRRSEPRRQSHSAPATKESAQPSFSTRHPGPTHDAGDTGRQSIIPRACLHKDTEPQGCPAIRSGGTIVQPVQDIPQSEARLPEQTAVRPPCTDADTQLQQRPAAPGGTSGVVTFETGA